MSQMFYKTEFFKTLPRQNKQNVFEDNLHIQWSELGFKNVMHIEIEKNMKK